MGYKTLQACVADLEKCGQLRRVDQPVSSHLEIGMIQRRVYQNGGPALLFTAVQGSSMPMLGNLFGTMDRTHFIFRDTVRTIEALVRAKIDPKSLFSQPQNFVKAPRGAWTLLPQYVGADQAPALAQRTTISALPQLVSWPNDGGAFITLPQVYTEDPDAPGIRHSNLGMYRVQISGNNYQPDRQIGLHYQIHRGIGVHHQHAARRGERLPVVVSVGGPPAMAVAAVMPLPEGMPEMAFAGLLAGHRMKLVKPGTHAIHLPAEADVCIVGSVDPHATLPEGPFGDHLGYYSLTHPFPYIEVEAVYQRQGAIWPFTTVGRPPQEDTSFGEFIHALTGELIPTVLPGVTAVHAVDAAGVHPLLLAIGSERYTPYDGIHRPMELLTQANAILGQGQLSLAKYLMIVAREDCPALDIHDIQAVFEQLLSRIDWRRDVHFQTATTIDTLDYSGDSFNQGSKVVFAAAGPPVRLLARELPSGLSTPEGWQNVKLALPGVITVEATTAENSADAIANLVTYYEQCPVPDSIALIVAVDDSSFTAATLDNWLWVTFTRSNPSRDIHGVHARVVNRHWGCCGPLIIDARRKSHHAPILEEDPTLKSRVESLAAPGGPLHGLY